ncbi:MAG: EAL domain-containing protein, partial [Caldimicrobium sp.]
HFGDQFLREVAALLEEGKRKGDVLARYGGDEFVFILPLCDLSQAVSFAERIREKLKEYKIKAPDDKEVSITSSISITIFPDHAENSKDLFVLADTLLYKSKREGIDRISFPSTEEILAFQKEISDTTFLIKDAIENRLIIPYFQPIFDLKNNNIFGYEVLMRIQTREEVLPASKFIHLAETLGLIPEMDFIVIEKALEMAIAKNYSGKLFFNLSPKEIIIPDFLSKLVRLVDNYNFPRNNIVFEITERETVKNLRILEKFIRELQDLGFLFCIDDFGSGFSSYHYIKQFFIDIIKMEGEFVVGLAKKNQLDLAIVESIVALCKRLNIKIIAEYVENEEIIKKLVDLGVDYGQGFYLGKPSPELL